VPEKTGSGTGTETFILINQVPTGTEPDFLN